MIFASDHALALLRKGSGDPNAQFREGQEEAIRHLVEDGGRLLVVQKTGWGKSFVYFIAVALLRKGGQGPALLVSPLLALMRNQITAAQRMGVRAVTINSDNQDKWRKVEEAIKKGDIDILLISPERFANDYFIRHVLAPIAARISMLVIDEAHCISDWGHDFRPLYRKIERIIRHLPATMRVLATTATANKRVMEDVKEVLGADVQVVRGNLNRPSLTLQTLYIPDQVGRLTWLAEHVKALPGHGIIYVLTVRDAHQVAEWLQSQGIAVRAYTAKEDGTQREALEQALLDNKVKALVATVALGMGYDKPDLSFVIHYQMPGSVVAYYQQVGRAGRAVATARGILLWGGPEDDNIHDCFIGSAFPTLAEVNDVLTTLERAPHGLSLPELEGYVNMSRKRLNRTVELLSLEMPAPIAKNGTKWQLTSSLLSEAFWQRIERLTKLRHEEWAQMKDYAALPFGAHMPFLIEALDGDASDCEVPKLPEVSAHVDAALVEEAIAFLRRTSLPIEPRKRWPRPGGMPCYGVRGDIPLDRLANPGKALCRWGDVGWGTLVKDGKYRDGRFSDDLVTACVEMIHTWKPDPAPKWVTCIPSPRHPTLVPDFAKRLAAALQLPFYDVIEAIGVRPEQKTMQNSTMQARNVDGSLRIKEQIVLPNSFDPSTPVLLVDDMVDSRWTLTVAAFLLRRQGCRAVWPMALAQTAGGS